jgi:uncharacterized protein (TIGR00369 family)
MRAERRERTGMNSVLHHDVPAGFVTLPPYGPFGDLVGPTWQREGDGPTVLGFRVADKHANRLGAIHGGMLCTLVDNALAFGLRRVLEARPGAAPFTLVTTQLSVNFMGNAKAGQWVEAQVEVMRAGRRMGFCGCDVLADGVRIVQASGQFLIQPSVATPGAGS